MQAGNMQAQTPLTQFLASVGSSSTESVQAFYTQTMLTVGEDAVEQQTSDPHSYTHESESESIMISQQRGLPISPGFSDRPPPTFSFLDSNR